MDRGSLIVALCREAGGTDTETELVEHWEANHACCCAFHAARAGAGDRQALEAIRRCMGLIPNGEFK